MVMDKDTLYMKTVALDEIDKFIVLVFFFFLSFDVAKMVKKIWGLLLFRCLIFFETMRRRC